MRLKVMDIERLFRHWSEGKPRDRYGARLLEANVRSFLSQTGKVNKGIRDTLRDAPERFMAYNNGIVLIADEASFSRTSDGSTGLSWLKGMQIVNGGQTTASIYFTNASTPKSIPRASECQRKLSSCIVTIQSLRTF